MNINHSFLILALISSSLMAMDKEPTSKKEGYRKSYASIDPKSLEKLASGSFVSQTWDMGIMFPIEPSKPKTYFHFAPIMARVGSQEVELGSSLSLKSTPETPINILADRIKYLPEDIKARAFAHFAQQDGPLKDRVTIDAAAALAKLYQCEANERLKKENPALYATLTKPIVSSEKSDEKKD